MLDLVVWFLLGPFYFLYIMIGPGPLNVDLMMLVASVAGTGFWAILIGVVGAWRW